MFLCCQCGKKLTNKQVYYLVDEIGKRPCCKEDFKQWKWQKKAKERALKYNLM